MIKLIVDKDPHTSRYKTKFYYVSKNGITLKKAIEEIKTNCIEKVSIGFDPNCFMDGIDIRMIGDNYKLASGHYSLNVDSMTLDQAIKLITDYYKRSEYKVFS